MSRTTPTQRPLPNRSLARLSLLGGLAAVFTGAWTTFRPEPPAVGRAVQAAPATSPAGVTQAALATGQFHTGVHPTSGTASILDLGNGRRVLRLTDFSTSDGPDVHVVLVAAADVTDNATAKRVGYVELGTIKGNKGNQNYDVPVSTDLAKYRTVTIWCERFSANFGSAPLTASH